MSHVAGLREYNQLLAKVTKEIEECAYIPYIWLRYGCLVMMKSLSVPCSYTPPWALSSIKRASLE